VFRLLRLLLSVAFLLGFIWFGMTVPLGSKTLFQHIKAIGESKETKDLVEGTKEAAKPVLEKVEHKLSVDGGVLDKHDAADRKALRKEIKKHLSEK